MTWTRKYALTLWEAFNFLTFSSKATRRVKQDIVGRVAHPKGFAVKDCRLICAEPGNGRRYPGHTRVNHTKYIVTDSPAKGPGVTVMRW